MADDDKKRLSPLELLDRDHLDESRRLEGQIKTLDKDLKDAEELVRETKQKIAALRREKLAKSFAYDTRRAELAATATAKAKAA